MKLVPSDSPALKTVCQEVPEQDIPALIKQWPELSRFMRHKKGCGMAAPQIGDCRRWFVWQFGIVINPKINKMSEDFDVKVEGCLSYPGKSRLISRSKSIDVEFIDQRGDKVVKTITGFPARVFQHEFDHLEGCCKVSL